MREARVRVCAAPRASSQCVDLPAGAPPKKAPSADAISPFAAAFAETFTGGDDDGDDDDGAALWHLFRQNRRCGVCFYQSRRNSACSPASPARWLLRRRGFRDANCELTRLSSRCLDAASASSALSPSTAALSPSGSAAASSPTAAQCLLRPRRAALRMTVTLRRVRKRRCNPAAHHDDSPSQRYAPAKPLASAPWKLWGSAPYLVFFLNHARGPVFASRRSPIPDSRQRDSR